MPTFTAPDGTRLTYHVKGRGEPLVCVPGGAMRASAYLGTLGGLDARRQLILLDLRGTGDSAVPDDKSTYRVDRQVPDLEALRAHLGLERMDVLAHSAGSNLALLYALRYPERVRRMVFLTPTLRPLGLKPSLELWQEHTAWRAGEPWYPRARAALTEIAGGGDSDELWKAVEPFFYGTWDDAAREHAAGADDQFNEEAANGYFAPGAFDVAEVREQVSRFPAPVLVLAGEHDWNPRPSDAREFADLLPAGRLVVQPGTVHAPWVDDGDFVVRHAAAFLDEGAVQETVVDGVRLAYRCWGRPDAPPMVLLHGLGGRGAHWSGVADELAAGHRVYALDLRGHGDSDRPGGYAFPAYAEDVAGFIRALDLGPVTLIGHSLGGLVGQLLAARHPELVERLVLEEAPSLAPADPPQSVPEAPAGLDFDWEAKVQAVPQRNAPDPAWAADAARITAPTLVIYGGPASFLPERLFKDLADAIPDCALVTVEAGHQVHETRPREFLDAVRGFLGQEAGGGAGESGGSAGESGVNS
ncbi:alpha/beta hydrolase [Streptomyces sp. NPDC051940]|uniref:alpha/beta fold hydrolase n=1 Tax=Streptomyces sp. NPDC051940 TaxID=3155675 RepID=UPI003418AC54